MEIRSFEHKDTNSVLELLEIVYRKSFTIDWWNWKYNQNPMGESIILVAEDYGKIVGLRSLWKYDLMYRSNLLKAYQPVDTVVHEEYRGQGLFTKLTIAAINEAKHYDADLLFNYPNQNSLPGYLKLGWYLLDNIRWWIKPIGIVGFLSVPLAKGQRDSLKIPGERKFLSCRGGSAQNETNSNFISAVRNPAFLEWRYASNPETEYGYLKSDDSKTLFRVTHKGKCRELLVMHTDFGDNWFEECFKFAKSNDIYYIANPAINGSLAEKKMKSKRFFRLKNTINFVALPLKDSVKEIVTDPLNWDFSLELLDTF